MRCDRSVVISLAQWERGTGNVKGRAVVFVLLRVHVCVAVSHFKNTILLYSVTPLLQKQTRIPLKAHFVIRIAWRWRAALHWWRGRGWSEPDCKRAPRAVGKPWEKGDREEGQLTPDCTPAVTGRRAAESPETQRDFFLFSFFLLSSEWGGRPQLCGDLCWWDVSRGGAKGGAG